MTTENPYPWADGMNCAVTVCDTGGTILYMNDKARTTFARHGDMIGKNLFDCHSERSRGIIRRLLADGGTNAYTIEKNGVRKMIYQTAWRVDGIVGGLAEISMPICRITSGADPTANPIRHSSDGRSPAPSIERPMTGARARCVCSDTSTRYLDPASGGRRKSSLRKSGPGTQPANGQQQAVKTKPRIPGCEQ